MDADTPKVGVALLNWNQYDDTARCLTSLRKSEFRPSVILVYDNGSEDGSGQRLKADFPEIELVVGEQNSGFSEGNNRAVKSLLDVGMDYIWILNNDTQVEPACLGALVRALEEDPDIGAVSAKIWFMDDRRSIGYAGGWFNHWTFTTYFRGLHTQDEGHFDHAEDTEILTGCCLLVRKEVVQKIGLFNRAFFAYAEDVDWSLRAGEAGIRLRYEPRAKLGHKMFGASRAQGAINAPRSSPRVEFLLSRNRFILVRLHTKPWSVRRWVALGYYLFLRRLPRAAGLLLIPDRRAAGLAIFKGLWAGLWIRSDPADSRL